MVPGRDSAGLVSPIIIRAILTTSRPCQTYVTAHSHLTQLPWHLRPPTPEICHLTPRGRPTGDLSASCFPKSLLETTGVALWVQFAAEDTPSGSAQLCPPALTIATTGPELMYFTSRP